MKVPHDHHIVTFFGACSVTCHVSCHVTESCVVIGRDEGLHVDLLRVKRSSEWEKREKGKWGVGGGEGEGRLPTEDGERQCVIADQHQLSCLTICVGGRRAQCYSSGVLRNTWLQLSLSCWLFACSPLSPPPPFLPLNPLAHLYIQVSPSVLLTTLSA